MRYHSINKSINKSPDAHTADAMPVAWFTDTPIERTQDIMLPEFELEKIVPNQCSADHQTYNYAKTEKGSKTGELID